MIAEAQSGQLRLSGILVADDIVSMPGSSFNSIIAVVGNLTSTVASQEDTIASLRARLMSLENDMDTVKQLVGMLPPPSTPPTLPLRCHPRLCSRRPRLLDLPRPARTQRASVSSVKSDMPAREHPATSRLPVMSALRAVHQSAGGRFG